MQLTEGLIRRDLRKSVDPADADIREIGQENDALAQLAFRLLHDVIE